MTSILKKAARAATMTMIAFGASPALAASPTTATATGTATVKIYSPLSIQAAGTNSVVDFGVLVGSRAPSVSPRAANDFVIDAAAAPTAGGLCFGAINWTCSGSPHRAMYTVSGSDASAVNVWITQPSIILNRAGGGVTADDQVPLDLTLDAADTNGDGYADVVLAGGAHDVYVGGTLRVSATDLDGVYTGSFEINADYQ